MIDYRPVYRAMSELCELVELNLRLARQLVRSNTIEELHRRERALMDLNEQVVSLCKGYQAIANQPQPVDVFDPGFSVTRMNVQTIVKTGEQPQ